MKKVLILGGLGMLGKSFIEEFNDSKYQVYSTYKDIKNKKLANKYNFVIWKNLNFQIAKDAEIKKFLKQFHIIINCIGIIKPYIDENNADSINTALKINSIFPFKLSKFVKKNVPIYQIATDCVFSGKSYKAYSETSDHDAVDTYGKSKSLGEINKKNFFNIRCSIIGNEIKSKKSLIEWFKSNKKCSKINGFKNHKWNGVTTDVFAHLVKTIIEKKIKIPNKLHLLPKDIINKYKLLLLLKNKFKRNDLIIRPINASVEINRTLRSKFVEKNIEIWKKSKFKKKLTIAEMIKLIK